MSLVSVVAFLAPFPVLRLMRENLGISMVLTLGIEQAFRKSRLTRMRLRQMQAVDSVQ